MVGRFGVFGTRADRIRPDTFEVPKDLVKPVPGPGYYNPNDKCIYILIFIIIISYILYSFSKT